ncbi:MAG: outer membrane protein assembly factor BamB [Oceanococcus sp.]
MIRTSLVLLVITGSLIGCASKSTVAEPEALRKIAGIEVTGKTQWSTSLANQRGLSGLRPLLVAGRVFVGDVKGKILAYDQNGEELWQQDTGYRLSSGPALADGALVFGTLDGEALALEASDGTVRWLEDLSSEVIAPPVADSSLVVLRSGDGRIYGLSPSDGARQWTVDRSVPALTLRGSGRMALDDEALYLGMDNGRVMAVKRDSGEPLWEEPISVPAGRTEIERIVDVDADLLLIQGVLFAASYGGDMVAMNAANGRALWRRSLASYTGMSVDAQCVYITDIDAVLWCLDPTNGAALWEQNQLKYRRLSAPLSYKGNVLVGDFEGYLHVVSAADGRIIGRKKVLGDAMSQPPQAGSDWVFVLDNKGKLRALDWQPVAQGS